MNPKMKSAIEKITLNDATFSNEVIEPTYVNFFYGKNGAGKSTIARTFKANDERLQWQAGKASTDYDVLVYDTDFINANLRNYGNLAGVFTVNETNIAIQEQVDTLNAERKKMGEEYNGHKAAIDQKTADKNTALSTFQSDCWSKSAEARTLFDEAIKGKKKFEEAILNKIGSRIDTEEIEKEIERLEKQHRQLTGAKARLGQQMDSLDIMDKFYEKKYQDRLVEDRLLVLAKNKSIFNAKVLHVNKNKLNQWTIGLIYDKYGIDGIDTLSRILCKKEKWNNMYTVFSYMLLIENWNKK